ncbi:class I SAM-dependent methyltransferase, partial [candidate division NPL-UPA2 bacterium]|nr:class I SAM-dependent methyltransferase [candidate division NPL-UPA2 bacterium]
YGREKHGLNIITGDLLELDLPSGAFDVVIMNQVIEHLELPLETLYKINKLLHLGGAVYIHTPNYDSLTLKRYRQFPKYYPKDHLYLFTDKTLKKNVGKSRLSCNLEDSPWI